MKSLQQSRYNLNTSFLTFYTPINIIPHIMPLQNIPDDTAIQGFPKE